jgi:hypothetical protein
MSLRNKRSFIEILRKDFISMVRKEGQTLIFSWKETTGGTWNPTYEIWEGGTETTETHQIKGVGKVVDYKENQMETEFGRIDVGECIVRFPHDVDFEPIKNREDLRFSFQGQNWRLDLPLGVGDMYGDDYFTRVIKGVKVID